VAYYGESDPAGTFLTTTLDASSVAGSLTVRSLDTTYLDTDNPDVSGIQLNSILTGITLQGSGNYSFWTQNALDYVHENNTLVLGEDTWNFSSGGAIVPSNSSTIVAHSPNGSVEAGIYIGFGPYLPAPTPFTLTLYLNSSVTSTHDQELWYNYSLAALGQPYRTGSYDWVLFNSTNAGHSGSVALAPFEASGSQVSPIGVPYDFEIDFGIAPYNGATMDTFSANVTATLLYCPATISACTAGHIRTVPAAEDYGSQTGETGSGLSFTYEGTTAYATGGPEILQGLWGFAGEAGNSPGATPVGNAILVSGEPVPSATEPYVFVFFNNTAVVSGYTWAPDAPVWYLMPGTYTYLLMLSDYAAQTGTLVVSTTATALSAVLPYSSTSGVYTPLWAFDNAALAGISSSGSGTISQQYDLFNNPTSSCTSCGGAINGNLSSWFFDYNDYLYATFPGVLLQGTTAYVDLSDPVSFTVYSESDGGGTANWYFELPIEFYHTSHVTLAHAANIGTWPAMFEILMYSFAPAAQNPFPQANVVVWDSTSDLIMSNRFSTESVPQDGVCGVLCTLPLPCFSGCVSPDELLLYGGSNNTVWGNVFTDPAGTALGSDGNAVYAGVAEAESGDLVYNNNFSVDNPVMLMAYDIYNDSCWASYAGLCLPLITPSYSDIWNVSNQSASNVANTVNGFPLSGNVLGAGYGRQGGNYWWNWGNAENPYATLPFVNRFTYTQNVTNLPGGFPALENSLRVGGDFVPLRPGYFGGLWEVSFVETGLTAGTNWSVTFNSVTRSSVTPTIEFFAADGEYSYSIGSVPAYLANLTHGSVTVSGHATSESIAFTAVAPATYSATFTETGLSPGTNWSVTVRATNQHSIGTSITFSGLANSTYSYTIGTVPGLTSTATPSSVVVDGANVLVSVTFTASPPSPSGASGLSPLDWGIIGGAIVVVAAVAVVLRWRSRTAISKPK